MVYFEPEEQRCNRSVCNRPSRPQRLDECYGQIRFRYRREMSMDGASGKRDPPSSTGLSPSCRRIATPGKKFLSEELVERNPVSTMEFFFLFYQA